MAFMLERSFSNPIVHHVPKEFIFEVAVFACFLGTFNNQLRREGKAGQLEQNKQRLSQLEQEFRRSNYEEIWQPEISKGTVVLVDPAQLGGAQAGDIIRARLTATGVDRLIWLVQQNILPRDYNRGDYNIKERP